MSLRELHRGTLTGLGIADVPGEFVTREVERLALTWGGVEGDRHFGLTARSGVRQKHVPRGTELRNARQLSLVSEEELAQVAAALAVPRLAFTWLGANLCARGVPALTRLPPSSRLVFPSGAVIAIDLDNLPCAGPGKVAAAELGAGPAFAARFVEAAKGLRGLVGWVERPGALAVGDAFSVWVR